MLNLTRPAKPAAFIGYDMGGAVAAGFAAKYPHLCAALSLISPLGIKYKMLRKEAWLNSKFFGEYLMMRRRHRMHLFEVSEAFPIPMPAFTIYY